MWCISVLSGNAPHWKGVLLLDYFSSGNLLGYWSGWRGRRSARTISHTPRAMNGMLSSWPMSIPHMARIYTSHGSCTFFTNSTKKRAPKMPSINTPKIKPGRSCSLRFQ